ncbi:MAG: helix-turn-helix domain-containing protein [Hamadaea sp.]|uniref:helix-turn-helix domain-containing protein n=1 Tax=Hamadaea sp. TaxID=2024425 RepID=UPI0017D6F3F1|nr:helix-turn-helix domain-containing protein [Hamadaea sp.]NUR74300.1 helix-turn-helix domain-containing protein [Hamadaea sp.]NUT24198.1 helix-turn-helix domain-containing protein [Hamadaea sp.]
MRDELQLLVDRIADRMGRPVLVEDRRQRVVCYSAQAEPLDEVRRDSILRRSTTPEVIAFFARFEILRARHPVRTPAEPVLGLLPRVCVPVWHSDLLLGFVWFVDSPALSDADVNRAVGLSADLALALYRVNLLGELTARREADAVRGLLADDPAVRADAATSVVGTEMLESDGPCTALVVPVGDPAVVEQALVATRRYCGHRYAVHLVRPAQGLLLVRSGSIAPADAAAHLAEQAESAVGVGDTVSRLADAYRSVAQAAQALALPTTSGDPASSRVALWSQLGVYRVLAAAGLGPTELHPGVDRLPPDLAATVEAYLDLAGDAAATAARLRIHRTTLYYRLTRAAELSSVDLRDGLQRLQLHLALKATHLGSPR